MFLSCSCQRVTNHIDIRAGSRIFRKGGRGPILGGGHFSVKMYAKTKELGPVRGRALARPPPDLPMDMMEY